MFNEATVVTKVYKIYGMDGHRQKESFNPSKAYDWSTENNVRVVKVSNSDTTGTNDYSIIEITCNTAEECQAELDGQLSDGIFENYRVGKIEEIK